MAVASSVTHLGGGSGGGQRNELVAVDGVTMLPAGNEWLQLVRPRPPLPYSSKPSYPSLLKQTLAELRLIACFHRAAFQVLRCGGLQSESTLQSSLCQWQLVAADDVARELKRAAMSRSR